MAEPLLFKWLCYDGGRSGGEGVMNGKVMAAFLQGGYSLVHEKRLMYKTNQYKSACSIYECQFVYLLTLVLRGRVNRMGVLDFIEKVVYVMV